MAREDAQPVTSPAAVRLLTVGRVLALLLPLLLIIGPGPADVGASLLACLFVGYAIITRDLSILRAWWFRIALIFWVFMLATAPFALADPSDALNRGLTFLRFPVLAAALGFWILKEPEWRDRYVAVLTAVVVFSALWALAEFVWTTQVVQSYSRPLRLYGPFTDRKVGIFLTKMMFPCLGLAVLWAVAGTSRRLVPLFAGFLLVLLAIFLSGERSAFLLAGLGCLIFVFSIGLGRIRRLMIGALFIGLIGGLGAYLVSPGIFDRQIKSTVTMLSRLPVTTYGLLWQSGIEVGELSPVIGVGGKNFRILCPEIRSPTLIFRGTDYREGLIFCSTHPHSVYPEIFSEHGVIGLAIFVAMIGGLVATYRGQRRDPVILGAGLGILLTLWPLVPHGSFFNNWNGIVFWSLVGVMVSHTTASANRRARAV
ncbi:O-antigen ligase family protein [Tistrella mobilis]|uniref:O-antigen ligase family protein n=1 Tax=Tistrella mobilis TaxID=171437 RepID=UPI003557835B